ncbi:AMP-binding protein [Streptomyces sp. NRRL F-2580]|uniref:AMP-binding protein n=1 Tax=Streptomyces sp. NRRL F-2580 TaxID=1463841 RepID=UPI0004C5EE29
MGCQGQDAGGSLLARGPYTPRGYYRAAGRNARAFTADGYLRTGDLARRTPDGNLVVTGRLQDVRRRADHEEPSNHEEPSDHEEPSGP